jgi:hypothetical protein
MKASTRTDKALDDVVSALLRQYAAIRTMESEGHITFEQSDSLRGELATASTSLTQVRNALFDGRRSS